MKDKVHTISILMENKFGVLARVAGLFCGRGYNIDSLTVSRTLDPEVSKMTVVTHGDDHVIEQIDKQLNKLIDVIKVTDLSGSDFLERELALVKVQGKTQEERVAIIQLSERFAGRIVNVQDDELCLEVSGESNRIDDFIKLVQDYGIIEVARTGRVAVSRSAGTTEDYSDL